MDLWDLDVDLDKTDEIGKSLASDTKPTFHREIPMPKLHESRKPGQKLDRRVFISEKDSVQMDVTHVTEKSSLSEPTPWESTSASEPEDDLELWDGDDVAPEIQAVEISGLAKPAPAPVTPVSTMAGFVKSVPETTPEAHEQVEKDDEFSPVFSKDAVPISLRPRLGLSNVERIGLIGLLVILMGGAVVVFLLSLRPLAGQKSKSESTDFPIKGSKVTIISGTSYWRSPIVEGAAADAFRRGTVLLPVLELAVTGGPADIRVFFRDEAGKIVGDAMTRTINGDGVLKIAATGGFDDPGMHAAYRTGASKPWTIEVRETATGAVSDGESTKLFEMNISTDRH